MDQKVKDVSHYFKNDFNLFCFSYNTATRALWNGIFAYFCALWGGVFAHFLYSFRIKFNQNTVM